MLNVDNLYGFSVVEVRGDVDIYTAPTLDECLTKLMSDGRRRLAVDLSECSYFDSEGIKCLIKVLRALGESGRIVVCGAKGAVFRVFEVSGLGGLFSLCTSAERLSELSELS